MPNSLRARLLVDLPVALRARDQLRTSVLRTTLAALSNAEAVDASGTPPGMGAFTTDVTRRDLSDQEIRAIVTSARDELHADAVQMSRLGQTAEAELLAGQADILTLYLET